jgi:hypothetical protein
LCSFEGGDTTVFERCLNEAERVLGDHREHPVPVKEVWDEVSRTAMAHGFEVPMLADFSALLEGDRRFEMIAAQEDVAGGRPEFPEDEEGDEGEMEKLGFFPEDRVRLRRFTPRRDPEADEEEIVSLPRVSSSRTPKKPAAAPKRSSVRQPASPKPQKKSPTPAGGPTVRRPRRGGPVRKASRPVPRRRSSGRRGRTK